jgi:signal transduction histidine kinase
VTVEAHLDRRPPPTIEATAYFVVAEALTNAAKYAEASHVTVSVDSTDNLLTTTVADDGKGGAKLSLGGSGLRGLTDRVSAADGDLEIESPPGHGTRVTCHLPLPREPEEAGSKDAQPDMTTGHVVGAPG